MKKKIRDGRPTAFCGAVVWVDVLDNRVLPDCTADDITNFKTLAQNSVTDCGDSTTNCSTICYDSISKIVTHSCVDRYGYKYALSGIKNVNTTKVKEAQAKCGVCTAEYSNSLCNSGQTCLNNQCVMKEKQFGSTSARILAVVAALFLVVLVISVVIYKNFSAIKEFYDSKILRRPSGYSNSLILEESNEL